MTMLEQDSPNPPSLSELLQRLPGKEYSIAKTLKKIQIEKPKYASGVSRISDSSFLSPHLRSEHIFAVLHQLGGKISGIRNTARLSSMGTVELDLDLGSLPDQPYLSQGEKFTTVVLAEWKKVQLVGSAGTNVIILTTEGNTAKRGLSTEQMDSAREWLKSHGIKVASEAMISQFHLDGPRILIESIAFIVDPSAH